MSSFWLLIAILAVPTLCDNCSIEEKRQLKEQHKKCTATVQERYSILTVESEDYEQMINTPMALRTGINNPGLEKEYVCRMIEETVSGCARIYKHCFNADEMRIFQDSQLHIISEIMSQIYNMGSVVEDCDVILEFKRSGREGSVLPTDKCTLQQVQAVSIDYQECIEGANEAMQQNIVQQETVENIIDVLCDGMNGIVHDCAHLLTKCYSTEEIIETKIGQLELTKKIFNDILKLKSDGKAVVDLNQCTAFSSMEYHMNSSQKKTSSSYFVLLMFILPVMFKQLIL